MSNFYSNQEQAFSQASQFSFPLSKMPVPERSDNNDPDRQRNRDQRLDAGVHNARVDLCRVSVIFFAISLFMGYKIFFGE